MPREKINDGYGTSRIEVNWSQEQHVQVATLSNNPKEFIEWCRELVSRADAAKADSRGLDMPHLSDSARMVDSDALGMFWTPNRYEINQLIRILRRARNAAFGADE